jgi:hypothetical protein
MVIFYAVSFLQIYKYSKNIPKDWGNITSQKKEMRMLTTSQCLEAPTHGNIRVDMIPFFSTQRFTENFHLCLLHPINTVSVLQHELVFEFLLKVGILSLITNIFNICKDYS